jgi:type I restriction enzyme, S subunit
MSGAGGVPALRFPEFSGEWPLSTLGDYFTFKNGVNADKCMYGQGRKFINVMDVIADGPIFYDAIIGSVEISEKEFAKNEVVYGDILFQRSSETREEVGQSNVYLDDVPATFGGFVIRGRPTVPIDSRFFDALLKTTPVRKDMTSRSGGSTRYNIGQESLVAVSVHVAPTTCEQQKIADFLGAVDARVGLLRRRRDALRATKKGMMQRLFSQELRFTKADCSPFPDWQEKRLGEVSETVTGSSNREDSTEEGDYVFFDRSSDVRASARFLFDCEAIIVAGEGKDFPPRHFVGKFDLHQRTYATIKFGENSGRFLFYWIDWHRAHFLKHSVGSTMPSLRMGSFSHFPVSLPHPKEQQKIADTLTAIDAKIDAVTAQMDAMLRFKKGLLQQMFV